MIRDIDEFRSRGAGLFPMISDACMRCKDPDCRGYIWVLPAEERGLLEAGFSIAQINGSGGPLYLDHFRPGPDGTAPIHKSLTICKHRATDGRCTRYANRPLVCAIYPLGLQTTLDGTHVWVLHRDCEYVRRAELNGAIDALLAECAELLASIAPELESQISDMWCGAADLWDVSNQSNFIAIRPLRSRDALTPAPSNG